MQRFAGSIFIACAALLWATDSLFRFPALKHIDALSFVFYEHLFGTVLLAIWIFIFSRKPKLLFDLTVTEWIAAILVGAGGSALATILFTASYQYINPSVAILLQKLQPIFVVFLSYFILNENLSRTFWIWALLALGSAAVLSLPDRSIFTHNLHLHSRGILFAFAAALLWALSTIAGKILLIRLPTHTVTFWRYTFGFSTLAVIFFFSPAPPAAPTLQILSQKNVATSLIYTTLVSGLLAMTFYYAGLARTRANIATFVELLFPIGAILVNTYFLDLPLSHVQLGASILLLIAVTRITWVGL